MASAPVPSLDFDPADLITTANYGVNGQPHSVWNQLREHAPVHYVETDSHPPFYAITRHADIMNISNKPHIFSNSEGPFLMDKMQTAARMMDAENRPPMRTIIEMDPPEHRDYRKVASGFFTPRSIHRLDEIVAECARAQIDKLGEEGECDFVEQISQRHPLRVLATILGIGPEDEDLLLELTQQLFAADDPDLQREAANRQEASQAMFADFLALFSRIVADRRENPSDDLASMLANAKMANGEHLPPLELMGYYLIVFTAGHDTTRNAISGGMLALLENPDQLALLRADPSLSRNAVREALRFGFGSIAGGVPRFALEAFEFRGTKIAKGDMVMVSTLGANRDRSVIADPDRFDITRDNRDFMSFGSGPHYCLGANLAMQELSFMLEAALEFLPEGAVLESGDDDWEQVGIMRRPIRMIVDLRR